MRVRDDLASLMAEVATGLQDADGEQPTVEAIVATAAEIVPDATDASITVHSARRGHLTLASSSTLATEADALQYSTGQGPCLDTAEEHVDFIRIGDVGVDGRWPTWGPLAAEVGVGSLLSVPLFSQQERIGALNLYAGSTGRFGTRETVDLALLYAVHAAHALSAARAVSSLEVALSSRHEIGVAQGIVMERHGLTLEQSFELLRRISSHTEVKLAALAHEIVSTRRLPTVDDRAVQRVATDPESTR